MTKDNVKRLINILGKHGGSEYNPIQHLIAKIRLIKKNEIVISELLFALKRENQEIIMNVAEILGLIGDSRAIPYLVEITKKNDLWGMTAKNVGVALIKLGDERGVEFLKSKIVSPKCHRDLRLQAAKSLVKLHKKNIFHENEEINFSGDTMTALSSASLKKLVNKLNDRGSMMKE